MENDSCSSSTLLKLPRLHILNPRRASTLARRFLFICCLFTFPYQFIKSRIFFVSWGKFPSVWFLFSLWIYWASQVGQWQRIHLPMQETQEMQVLSLGWEDPLEKGMVTHSSILAWKIHKQRSLAGDSLWGCKELDMTEQLTLYLISSNSLPNCSVLISVWQLSLLESWLSTFLTSLISNCSDGFKPVWR